MILGTVKGLAPLQVTTASSETPAPVTDLSGASHALNDRVLLEFVGGRLYILHNIGKLPVGIGGNHLDSDHADAFSALGHAHDYAATGHGHDYPVTSVNGRVGTVTGLAESDHSHSAGGDTSWHTIGASGEPAFQNGWVDYGAGYPTPGFQKDAQGYVHFRGLVKGGTLGAAAFTLPVGYRPGNPRNGPSTYVMRHLIVHGNNAAAFGGIMANGNVNLSTTNAWWELGGINPFLAEA